MIYLTLLLFSILYSKSEQNSILNGVYNIANIFSNLYLNINKNKLILSPKNKSYFKIIYIKNSIYYIKAVTNYKLGINSFDKIILDKIEEENDLKFQWNIINIKKNYIKRKLIISNR